MTSSTSGAPTPWLARALAWLGLAPAPEPPPARPQPRAAPARGQTGRSGSEPRSKARPLRGGVLPAWNERQPSPSTDAISVRNQLTVLLHAAAKKAQGPNRAFHERLLHVVMNGDPTLPIFPDVALRLDRLLRHGDPSLAEVNALVANDPELVRRAIQAASAAAHGRNVPDLPRAVLRIGLDGLWRVSMTAVLHSPVFRVTAFAEEAGRARRAALVAGEIAGDVCPDPSERGRAFLSGVLHEIGTLQVLRYASFRGRDAAEPKVVRAAIAEYGAGIGLLVGSGWSQLDPEIGVNVGRLPGVKSSGDPLAARCARVGQIAADVALAAEEAQASKEAHGAKDSPAWSRAVEALDLAEDPFVLRDAARNIAARLEAA